MSFSGGGASEVSCAFPEPSDCEPYNASATTDTISVQQLVQDKAERVDESHGESTEQEWLAIAAEILYASSDSSLVERQRIQGLLRARRHRTA